MKAEEKLLPQIGGSPEKCYEKRLIPSLPSISGAAPASGASCSERKLGADAIEYGIEFGISSPESFSCYSETYQRVLLLIAGELILCPPSLS